MTKLRTNAKHRIVVGVDGSDGARLALRWAAEEAVRRNGQLELVHTWHITYAGEFLVPNSGDLQQSGREVLDAASDEAREFGADVTASDLVSGGAAQALLDKAKGADLLVVGSRGRGGFGALLLGSTSQQCVHHAPCPVVVPASWRSTNQRTDPNHPTDHPTP